MGFCKDCSWWNNKACTNNTKIGEDISWVRDEYGTVHEIKNVDMLSYSEEGHGVFNTGPLFGCVHHNLAVYFKMEN